MSDTATMGLILMSIVIVGFGFCYRWGYHIAIKDAADAAVAPCPWWSAQLIHAKARQEAKKIFP